MAVCKVLQDIEGEDKLIALAYSRPNNSKNQVDIDSCLHAC